MAADLPTPSAEILSFRPRWTSSNIFTTRDRLDVLQWQAAERSGVRLAIHKRDEGDPPEIGEFASIYLAGRSWAVWGAARQGRQIRVWRACDGRDLGWFETMREVLAMVSGWTGPCGLEAAAGRSG